MIRQATLALALTALLAAPAGACDPEDLWKEMRAICTDFVTQANASVSRVHDRLSAAERTEVGHLTREALGHCEGQTFGPAAQAAARLGVLIGRLEAKYGVVAHATDTATTQQRTASR